MKIYAYTLPQVPEREGWIKIGQSKETTVEKRIKAQLSQANLHYEVLLDEPAIAGKRNVTDREIHRYLEEQGFEREGNSEWFWCTPEDVKDALDFLKQQYINEDKRNDLSEKFYEELRNWYYWATEEQYQGLLHEREPDPDHALRIIVRLLLIFFLKEKELVPAELFDENWVNENLKDNEEHSYYNAILRNLFFHCLNTQQNDRNKLEYSKLMKNYGKIKEHLHKKIPFLNGGLFNEHPGDDFALNNQYFFSGLKTIKINALGGKFGVKGLITILKGYRYTLDETDNSEYIDPEFIGKTFECLLACIEADNKESRRKITGSYYTPREIVDYMVNESLDAYLESIERSVDENLLLRCMILDPACGSGAFPCGVMNAIMKRIDPDKTLTQSERYTKKLEILRNVIYGVDIQPMAVQISTLRLFLSLLQEIIPKPSAQNFGITPLPNLDYKFVVANTLMGINGQELFFHEHVKEFNQLIELQKEHFRESHDSEKNKIKSRIEKLEKELAEQSESKHIEALCRWNYSDTKAAEYFDSRWMFGIDKFDIVIGNPPYGAKYSAEQKDYFLKHYESAKTTKIEKDGMILGKQKGSLDTFSLFIENGFNNLREGGYLMFIVPLSVISSDSMTALHTLLFENCGTMKVSSYSDRPKQVFGNSRRPVSIISFFKTMSACKSILTTRLYRLFSDISLQDLIKGIVFTESQKHYKPGCFARISETIESSILDKIYSKSNTLLRNLIKRQTEGSPLYYRQADGGYYSLVLNHSTNSKYESVMLFDKRYVNVIGAILSSNLFFWHQKVYSDNYHLKQNDIKTFPIPLHKLTDDVIRKIEKLYVLYERDVERNAIIRETNAYSETKIIKEYKLMNARDFAHKIDGIICLLYGLTDEEREFIKNYERQFRINEKR